MSKRFLVIFLPARFKHEKRRYPVNYGAGIFDLSACIGSTFLDKNTKRRWIITKYEIYMNISLCRSITRIHLLYIDLHHLRWMTSRWENGRKQISKTWHQAVHEPATIWDSNPSKIVSQSRILACTASYSVHFSVRKRLSCCKFILRCLFSLISIDIIPHQAITFTVNLCEPDRHAPW